MNDAPLFSIVMPSYQQAGFLEEAVRSVLDQPVNVELLVMDPGSTDGSREILMNLGKEYGDKLVLCFEPDQGQSDAINRGFSRARGNVFGWLNSDDRLRAGALSRVLDWLDVPSPRWTYGRAGMIDELGRPHSGFIVFYKNFRGRTFSRLKLLTENFIPQMAVFWNRAMWETAGGLDNDRHLDMDYDLWLRFAKISQPQIVIDTLADFRIHGAAKGSRETADQLRAACLTAKRHASDFGWKGKAALFCHRLFGFRTRMIYYWLKPR